MALVKDFLWTLSINGEDFGGWDAGAGGGLDHPEEKYTPFDGVERTALGNATTGNVTFTRDYRPERDGAIVKRQFELGDGDAVGVCQDRDKDGNFQQNRPPISGKVKAITPPDTDSNASDTAKISIEVSTGQTT